MDWIDRLHISVLRLNRLIVERTGDDSLLDYFGPEHHRLEVAAEVSSDAGLLVQRFGRMREDLDGLNTTPDRRRFLDAIVRALETTTRRLNGEVMSLRQQVGLLFDVDVAPVPEAGFERAHAMLDHALPGTGSIASRLGRWRRHYVLPRARMSVVGDLVTRAIRESGERLADLLPAISSLQIDVDEIRDLPVRAVADYVPGSRSRVLINPAVEFNVADLCYLVCHEAIPGHIAELELKHQALVLGCGYREHLVGFLLTPPFVVSEGLAMWAHEFVFPGDEEQRWLEGEIYPLVGLQPDGSHLRAIHQATDLLQAVRGNAALMLEDGRSHEDVADYLQEYALLDPPGVERAIQAIQRPYCEAYVFTYQTGRALLDSWMNGPNRDQVFTHCLTHQVLPSDLVRARHNGAVVGTVGSM
jgi:hypothetical protein